MNAEFGQKRKAVTDVIATVVLIAITLIAAVAIAGFAFGLFQYYTSNAQVTVVNAVLLGGGASTTLSTACATAAQASPASYVVLSNTGTASTFAISVSLTVGGSTYTASASSCMILAAGGTATATSASTMYLQVATAKLGNIIGTQFTGSIVLSNGAAVPFSGSLQ